MRDLHCRHLERGRHEILGQRGVQQLSLLVVLQLLVERVADALRHPAVDLALDDRGVDQGAAVVHHDVLVDPDIVGVDIDLDDHGVHAGRCRPHGRTEIARRFQARLGTWLHGAAQRIGKPRKLTQADAPGRRAGDLGESVGEHDVDGVALEVLRGMVQHLAPHHRRGIGDGTGGDHRAAAGKCPGAPAELVGVAGDDMYAGQPDPELPGDELSEGGEMALPLRADARRHQHLAVRLHGNARALVRTDTGAFDIADDANPEMPALGARRLLPLGKVVVADQRPGLGQQRGVVAAVVGELAEILVDEALPIGEAVWRYEIALADLGPVESEFLGGDVEQALDHEDAVLPAGAAIGRDQCLVGERDREAAVVVLDVVGTEQRALTVERNGEPVVAVGTAVMDELVLDAEYSTIRCERHLRDMHLAALVGGRREVLEAVLDPLHRPGERHADPRNQHLLWIEHHHLRTEAAADERRHYPHLVLAQPQHAGQAAADDDRRLRGVPHGQPFVVAVPVRHDAPGLHRARSAMVVDEAPPDDEIGPGGGPRVVALCLARSGGQVVGQVLVDAGLSRGESPLDVDHRLERLVVDHDLGHGILGDIAVDGYHNRDRLADVANLVFGERQMRAHVEDRTVNRRRMDQERCGLRVGPEVGERVDRLHTFASRGRRTQRCAISWRAHVDCARRRNAACPASPRRRRTDRVPSAAAGPRCVPPTHPACRASCCRRMRFAASKAATTMFWYPVQRHRLPEIASRMSLSVGSGWDARYTVSVVRTPAVQ